MHLSQRSRTRLIGVHPDLIKVVERAAKLYHGDFAVIEGMRTVARQRELVRKGASKTMNSRHLTGHAVDIVPLVDGKVSWSWQHYYPLAKVMKQAAADLRVPLEWGGDWKTFKDGPHWQLPWKTHPISAHAQIAATVGHPEYTDETERGAATKAIAASAGGVLTGTSLAADPLQDALNAVVFQQGELTSGELGRIAVAALIIAGTLYFAWRKTR